MSTDAFLKGFLVALISLFFAWVVFSRYDSEVGSERDQNGRQRYLPYVPGMLLPMMIAAFGGMWLYFYGPQRTMASLLSMLFVIFLHISIYDGILLLLLPVFRKYISARTCALLWMIPNYLYLTQLPSMAVNKPLWVIRAPEKVVWSLFLVWALGFFLVLFWKILAHLVFRRSILKGAEVVRDPKILAVLEQEVKDADFRKPKFQVMCSANVSSPLSIGLFRRSMQIVLPDREFSEEELKLIFRHELIHIGREDTLSKFFLLLCTAMCWFNPLMWIAMRKSADDLELSCDETVLLDCHEAAKRQYADLILKTAGDDRGFTTCLSASASTMRYRLSAIMQPQKNRSGAWIVGLLFFALCMSCGYVSLAYGEHTGREAIFADQELSSFTLNEVYVDGEEYKIKKESIDASAISKYLADLTVVDMSGNYSFSDEDRRMAFRYTGPIGSFWVQLRDSYVRILPLYGERPDWRVYYLPKKVDWGYLGTLFRCDSPRVSRCEFAIT